MLILFFFTMFVIVISLLATLIAMVLRWQDRRATSRRLAARPEPRLIYSRRTKRMVEVA